MKNRVSITNNFDNKSTTYDLHYKTSLNPYSVEKNIRLLLTIGFLQKINHSFENQILDYGCGTGVLAEKLQDKIKRFHYTGFDISHNMINVCNKKFTGCSRILFSHNEKELSKYSIIVSLGVIGYQLNQNDFLSDLLSYFNDTENKYLIITVGSHNLYRIIRDKIKKIYNKNKPVYSYTPKNYISELLNTNQGKILETHYLLPIFKFLPVVSHSKLLSSFYLTKYLVVKFN